MGQRTPGFTPAGFDSILLQKCCFQDQTQDFQKQDFSPVLSTLPLVYIVCCCSLFRFNVVNVKLARRKSTKTLGRDIKHNISSQMCHFACACAPRTSLAHGRNFPCACARGASCAYTCPELPVRTALLRTRRHGRVRTHTHTHTHTQRKRDEADTWHMRHFGNLVSNRRSNKPVSAIVYRSSFVNVYFSGMTSVQNLKNLFTFHNFAIQLKLRINFLHIKMNCTSLSMSDWK